jgi:hypothetical protein
MAKPPLWFQSLVWAEMLIQVPFFFVAVYAFAKCAFAALSCPQRGVRTLTVCVRACVRACVCVCVCVCVAAC